MKSLKKEYESMYEKYPVGQKIIFDSFEFDKLGLNSSFYMKKGDYTVKKHGFFSVHEKHFVNIYFDKGIFLQICYTDEEVLGYWVFKIFEKHFLRNSFDRGFWLGGKEERGFMFYDDYFYGRDPWKFFGEFLENFCRTYFKDFREFDDIEYEVEDAYCSTNLFQILKSEGFDEKTIKDAFDEELKNREWIIDYAFDGELLEIYYHFNDNDLEKRFKFMKNASYYIKMVENKNAYDKKIQASMFYRDVEDEFYEKEYLGISYDEELSLVYLSIAIPIDITDFRKGENDAD